MPRALDADDPSVVDEHAADRHIVEILGRDDGNVGDPNAACALIRRGSSHGNNGAEQHGEAGTPPHGKLLGKDSTVYEQLAA